MAMRAVRASMRKGPGRNSIVQELIKYQPPLPASSNSNAFSRESNINDLGLESPPIQSPPMKIQSVRRKKPKKRNSGLAKISESPTLTPEPSKRNVRIQQSLQDDSIELPPFEGYDRQPKSGQFQRRQSVANRLRQSISRPVKSLMFNPDVLSQLETVTETVLDSVTRN